MHDSERRRRQREWGLDQSGRDTNKPIIVGEADPCGREIGDDKGRFLIPPGKFYESDPAFALWPEPRHTSGARLCSIMGLYPKTFAQSFDRTNLFRTPPENWSERDARIAAGSVPVGSRVALLLGRKVHRAFGLAIPGDWSNPFWDEQHSSTSFLLLPHPSGVNRDWNDVTLVPRLRNFLFDCLFGTNIPFGEADDSFGPEARERREENEYADNFEQERLKSQLGEAHERLRELEQE